MPAAGGTTEEWPDAGGRTAERGGHRSGS